ncbi:DUF4855 domain-containing protein [Paenibacillus sp. GCM10027626]|uniref:DUF4855 domain-containing protein n=1 Tax=Paenibacillus sp. GCM10027626 TaxID=3273411 RepID=UPI0036408EAE
MTKLRNLAFRQDYDCSRLPENIAAEKCLTQGEYAACDVSDPRWQRHLSKVDRKFAFHFDRAKSIRSIKLRFFQGIEYAVYYPEFVTIYVSDNGEDWSSLARIHTRIPLYDEAESVQTYQWDGKTDGVPGEPQADMVYTRHVRIDVPVDVWVFMDSIELWGTDEKAETAVVLSGLFTEAAGPAMRGYHAAGESSGGVHNMVLLYNGYSKHDDKGDRVPWSREQLLPFVAYTDSAGRIKDWMFDSVLLLELWAPNGNSFIDHGTPADVNDWRWYLEHTFCRGSMLDMINDHVSHSAEQLQNEDYRMKAVLMIPYPSDRQAAFGKLAEDGEMMNFDHRSIDPMEAYRHKCTVIDWYIHEALSRWEAAGYSHLELAGFYWMNENVNHKSPGEQDLIRYAGSVVHELGLKYYWIPYFEAPGFWRWKELGFDAAILQPNYFFGDSDAGRIKAAADWAALYGMGVEIEVNESALKGEHAYNKYADYLEGGAKYGYNSRVLKGYYQDRLTFYHASLAQEGLGYDLYHKTYQFIKGARKK